MSNLNRLSNENEITNATHAFWGALADKFPEIKSGDNQISGQDRAAFLFLANGTRHEDSSDLTRWDLPSAIKQDRFSAAVAEAMAVAETSLAGVIEENRAEAYAGIELCARHFVYHNLEEPEPGTFTVHVYSSKAEWDACKGAGESIEFFDSIDDAKDMATNEEFSGAYEVTIQAIGHHEAHEAGEVVFSRFSPEAKKPKARP